MLYMRVLLGVEKEGGSSRLYILLVILLVSAVESSVSVYTTDPFVFAR